MKPADPTKKWEAANAALDAQADAMLAGDFDAAREADAEARKNIGSILRGFGIPFGLPEDES